MLKTKLERFIAKRVLICVILLTIIDLVLLEHKWFVLIGLIPGAIFSLAKFGSYAWVFGKILGVSSKAGLDKLAPGSSIAVFMLNQFILLPLLFIAYFLHQWIFIGFIAGILLVPFVVMINCMTEGIGITKNHFE